MDIRAEETFTRARARSLNEQVVPHAVLPPAGFMQPIVEQPIQEATVRGRAITGGYPADGRYTIEHAEFAYELALAMLDDGRVSTRVPPGMTKAGNPFFVLSVSDEPGAEEFAKEVGRMATMALRLVARGEPEISEFYRLALQKVEDESLPHDESGRWFEVLRVMRARADRPEDAPLLLGDS